MPPRLRSLSRPGPKQSLFFCPACSLWRLAGDGVRSSKSSYIRRCFRNQTTASATTPATRSSGDHSSALKKLYNALKGVEKRANNFVSLSRLQLALRSLESREPVVRIAVLGVDDDTTAIKRVIRLLIADPLNEEGSWEPLLYDSRAFSNNDIYKTPGLLLRYGDETTFKRQSAALSVATIPSRLLQVHNIEILVSTLPIYNRSRQTVKELADGLQSSDLLDRALVPVLEDTGLAGRYASMTHPVHKTVIYGEGIDGIVSLSKICDFKEFLGSDLLNAVVDVSSMPQSADTLRAMNITPISVASASKGLDALRESVANSSVYQHAWSSGNVDTLLQWITRGISGPSNGCLKPFFHSYISQLLSSAFARIDLSSKKAAVALQQQSVSDEVRVSLSAKIDAWAQSAHSDLQQQMECILHDRLWKRLAWWKLLWRVDDISQIVSELIERGFLVSAEQEAIYFVGRLDQAGLLISKAPASPDDEEKAGAGELDVVLSHLTRTDLHLPPPDPILMPSHRSYPLAIPLTRRHLLSTVPALQRHAQSLLLQTLSTTGITAVLSALLYVSSPAISLYSASAAVAVGLSWSLRRLQRKWEEARSRWLDDAKEAGGRALRGVEAEMRLRIRQGGVVSEDEVAREERQDAYEAVRLAKAALDHDVK